MANMNSPDFRSDLKMHQQFFRALDDILREHIGKICYVYIDDIIVFGEDEQSHLDNIAKVFKTLQDAIIKC